MKSRLILAFLISALTAIPPSALGASILLNAETPQTGSNLVSSPLLTPLGTISYFGVISSNYENDMGPSSSRIYSTDNGFVDGTTGQVIRPARFTFDFDVESISFIYGGNNGNILVEALDASRVVVDSFFRQTQVLQLPPDLLG